MSIKGIELSVNGTSIPQFNNEGSSLIQYSNGGSLIYKFLIPASTFQSIDNFNMKIDFKGLYSDHQQGAFLKYPTIFGTTTLMPNFTNFTENINHEEMDYNFKD